MNNKSIPQSKAMADSFKRIPRKKRALHNNVEGFILHQNQELNKEF